jgi:hypothetical protein
MWSCRSGSGQAPPGASGPLTTRPRGSENTRHKRPRKTPSGLCQTEQYFAADAFARGCSFRQGDAKAPLGVVVGVALGEREAAVGNLGDAAPLAPNHAKYALDAATSSGVALRRDGAGILIFDPRLSAFELRDAHENALEQVERFEAGHDDGNPIALGDGLVLGRAHHRANVAGGQKAVHRVFGRSEDGTERRRHEHV